MMPGQGNSLPTPDLTGNGVEGEGGVGTGVENQAGRGRKDPLSVTPEAHRGEEI